MQNYSFTSHTVNIWNSLPDHVIDADSTHTFQSGLDKFWLDWKTDLTGTGSSLFKCESILTSNLLKVYILYTDIEAPTSSFQRRVEISTVEIYNF